MLSSAKQEILEVFCTSTDTYSNLLLGLTEEHVVDSEEKQQEEERGGAQLLKQMAATPGLSARIIAPDNNIIIKELKQRIPKEHSSQQDKIQIQFYQPHLHFKVPTMLIVDQKESLLLELMDDEKKPNEPSTIRRVTYSNNESTVSSYIWIFETLWMQNTLMAESL